MSRDKRDAVMDCRYWSQVRGAGGGESARCGLLAEVTGIEEPTLLEVRRDACETCCRLPAPSPTRINHVNASHLYTLAQRVLERGGVPGCDPGKAVGIRQWAEQNIRFDGGEDPTDLAGLALVGVADACLHFGEPVEVRVGEGGEGLREAPVHLCRHPDRRRTTREECFTCRHWTDRPEPASHALPRTLPPSPPRRGPKVARWAVGVTTTRRYLPTLAYCLDSLIRAGWEEPRIFADSSVDLAERHRRLPFSLREPRLGAWPNYYLSMVELLMREPRADAYMLVQDDAVFHDREDLRAYLEEEVLWPSPETAFVSLYCSKSYTRDLPGWYELERAWVWGAVALIFPAESAKRMVRDEKVFGHRWSAWNDGCANIDVVLGDWARRSGLNTFFPTPSLAQHIGESSTLWPRARARGSRRASDFAGERRENAGSGGAAGE